MNDTQLRLLDDYLAVMLHEALKELNERNIRPLARIELIQRYSRRICEYVQHLEAIDHAQYMEERK